MSAHNSISQFLRRWAIAAWLAAVGPAHAADSFLGGQVTDSITGKPVAGAEVYVEYSGQRLGSATTDTDGVYRIPYAIPTTLPVTTFMTAGASSAGHGITKTTFQVNSGQPTGALGIVLYPTGLLECRSQSDHSVIIGNFLPPTGAGALDDLSSRIARSLEFALKTRLQSAHLALTDQPSFEACESAKPKTSKMGAAYAKALLADAFVGGDVAHVDGSPNFAVSFYVSDAYGLFVDPQVAVNTSVNLNSPVGASVSGETHAAVLASIAAGLASKNDCVAAITVLTVAERLVDAGLPYAAALRSNCAARIPNVKLREK